MRRHILIIAVYFIIAIAYYLVMRYVSRELAFFVLLPLLFMGRTRRYGRFNRYRFYNYDNVSDRYYENLLDSYERYNSFQQQTQVENPQPLTVQQQVSYVSKIDVNSCSEEQLIALPGINVILAKRIIKIREETGGFTDLEQFVKILGINSSMASKLSELVIFEKPKYVPKVKRRTERNIDL